MSFRHPTIYRYPLTGPFQQISYHPPKHSKGQNTLNRSRLSRFFIRLVLSEIIFVEEWAYRGIGMRPLFCTCMLVSTGEQVRMHRAEYYIRFCDVSVPQFSMFSAASVHRTLKRQGKCRHELDHDPIASPLCYLFICPVALR